MTDDNKISSLYQQGNDQQPPEHLDKLILKTAHDAVHEPDLASAESTTVKTTTVKSGGPFSGGWRAKMSIAALILITVILVPLLEQEPAQHSDGILQEDMPADMEVNRLERERQLVFGVKKEKKRTSNKIPLLQSAKPMRTEQYRRQTESDSTDKSAGMPMVVEEVTAPQPSAYSVAPTAAAAMAIGKAEKQQVERSSKVSTQKKSTMMMDADSVGEMETEGKLENYKLDPYQWLQRINKLLEQGDIETARKQLADFRLRYPDEKIDQSILDKIK
jgi:hypothetical protein